MDVTLKPYTPVLLYTHMFTGYNTCLTFHKVTGDFILLIILPINSLLFSGVDEISCDLVEGKAGVTACEHVCVEQ